MTKDNSHPWVRISHGLNNFVTDLIDKEYDDNEQETCETKTHLLVQADQRPKQNHEDLPLLAHLQELYIFMKEHGLMLNQELNQVKRTQ